MSYGKQAQLAKMAGTTRQIINGLLRGHKNTSPDLAKTLGRITASDPFIWMRGGDKAARKQAFENWDANEAPIIEGDEHGPRSVEPI